MEQLQSNDVMVKYRDVYSSIDKQLNDKNLQDKKTWIEKKHIFPTQVKRYEEQLHLTKAFQGDTEAQKADADFLSEYQSSLQTDIYADLNAHLQIYQHLHTYCNRMTKYQTYLDSILKRTDFLKNNLIRIMISDEKL